MNRGKARPPQGSEFELRPAGEPSKEGREEHSDPREELVWTQAREAGRTLSAVLEYRD